MTRNIRIIVTDHPYFITNVTRNRQPLLLEHSNLLWRAVDAAHNKIAFDLIAWVILPEHFHFLVKPDGGNISDVLKKIKQIFAAHYRKQHSLFNGPVWQSGFHDHIIRDEEDFNRHLDYIHYNPVKHGLTGDPFEYSHSSLMNFGEYYPPDWGIKAGIQFDGDFGE